MRILIVGTTYHPARNGQAIFTTNLAVGLAQLGHTACMVYPSETGTPYRELRNGVHIDTARSLSLRRWHPNAYLTPFPQTEARARLDQFKPDLVHIQDHYWLCHSFMEESKRRGIKVLGTNHFMPENLAPYLPLVTRSKSLYNRLLWMWMLATYNQTDLVTVQSRASATLLQSQGLRVPIQSVSCGIDLDRFRPQPNADKIALRQRFGLSPKRITLLFVGRVDGEKKLGLMMRALAKLDRPDLEFAIAGKGAAFGEMQKLAASLHLGDRVRFLGYVPDEDLPALLNCVDIFVMPSEAELLSIASLEAMACGRPLLLANAVALPELVTNGENGYLFTPGDQDDLARRITDLVDHPEAWPAMQQASIRRANAHGLGQVLAQYERIYRSMLGD